MIKKLILTSSVLISTLLGAESFSSEKFDIFPAESEAPSLKLYVKEGVEKIGTISIKIENNHFTLSDSELSEKSFNYQTAQKPNFAERKVNSFISKFKGNGMVFDVTPSAFDGRSGVYHMGKDFNLQIPQGFHFHLTPMNGGYDYSMTFQHFPIHENLTPDQIIDGQDSISQDYRTFLLKKSDTKGNDNS